MISQPVNFRDLGGTPTEDGHTLRPKMLLRAGELYQLPAEARTMLLDEYALTTVVDLRDDNERAGHPNDDLPVKTVHIDLAANKEEEQNTASKNGLEEMSTTPQHAHEAMTKFYVRLMTNETSIKELRRFVDVLLEQEDGSILFHCFAGKDRTGICAATALSLLGVSRELIMEDYLKTNVLRRAANEAMVEELRQKGMSEERCAAFLVIMYVHEDYLNAAFDCVQAKYGSYLNFCREALGVTDDEIARLRARYLQ
ncbi:tyrosine-protein phosphatase [Ruminococcaceae bacterium OttesenSCG-928-N02]|nr:tyrosine-protein phosphatase [Ruminococcaceae bacterium OttesenSCG-928-N02]